MGHEHGSGEFVAAPAWGLFVGKLGQGALWATLIGGILVFLLSFYNQKPLVFARKVAFYTTMGSTFVSFLSLAALSIGDQFQFAYIWGHSEHKNPLAYKLSAIWTNQEGSLLLSAVTIAVWGLLTYAKSGAYERSYGAVFGLILTGFATCLIFETPFNIIPDAIKDGVVLLPRDGNGMVPTLQNYWLVIHPPTMFLGFGSLVVPLAYGVASMIHGNYDDWIKQARAVTLAGMAILGLGIVMGGLWAYETLGWGGFWAWDPVENFSIVPWLLVVCLAHGFMVQTARGVWKSSNLLLSGLPFLTFLYGTFLTRSGLLDGVSVHSFASMDKSALSTLRYFLFGALGVFGVIYALRGIKQPTASSRVQAVSETKGVDRTSMFQFGVLSLSLLAFVISIGMSWPVISVKLLGATQGASIEQNIYHKIAVWFFIAIMIPMAIAPYIGWRKESWASVAKKFVAIGNLSLMTAGLLLIMFKLRVGGLEIAPDATVEGFIKGSTIRLDVAMALLVFFCAFTGLSNLWKAIEIFKKSKLGIGSFVSHFGIAILLGGLIISKGFEQSIDFKVQQGFDAEGMGYKIAFKDYDPDKYYDRNNVVKFDVTAPNGEKYEIAPTLYYYPSNNEDKSQTWPFIRRGFTHDIYFFMQAPIVDFFKEPMNLKPGESKSMSGVTVTYLKQTREGEPGVAGTKFGAELEVKYDGGTYRVNPTLTLGEGGLKPSLPQVGDSFRGVLTSMDAATKSVNFQMLVSPPLYPIQIFYKPMTGLVWLGTGVFFIGGLISAYYRRLRKKVAVETAPVETETISDKLRSEEVNAPIATA
jgi:cytochrome c-type biogenesis protein CcmF